MENNKEPKKEPKTANGKKESKGYLYSNDLGQSFFSYLQDLKKFEIPSADTREELIWQTDQATDSFRRIIFAFAPVITDFINLLSDINTKETPEDIFIPSALQQLKKKPDEYFFNKWQQNIAEHFKALEKNYSSTDGDRIRTALIQECCFLKINNDHLEQFFNLITDYITAWDEKNITEKDLAHSIKNLNMEQKELLSQKFMLPANALDSMLEALLAARHELTMLRNEILKNHLRLVISIAGKFRNRGVLFNDIIQEGNLGLMRAIDKFDPHLGHKFSTYAVWWIKQNIIHSIADQSRTIRIPTHMLNLISKISSTEQQLLQLLGREPSSEEIAERLELSTAKVNAVRAMAQQAISLQAPLNNQSESFSLEDTLKDNHESKDFTDFDRDVTYKMLYKMLAELSPREQQIIVMRFGLFGHKVTAFAELSEKFNLTRERVRQLELKILNKLRAPDKLKLLDYYSSNPKNKV